MNEALRTCLIGGGGVLVGAGGHKYGSKWWKGRQQKKAQAAPVQVAPTQVATVSPIETAQIAPAETTQGDAAPKGQQKTKK